MRFFDFVFSRFSTVVALEAEMRVGTGDCMAAAGAAAAASEAEALGGEACANFREASDADDGLASGDFLPESIDE